MGQVKIACRQIGGVQIRLWKKGWDDGTGDNVRPTVVDGPPVALKGPSARLAGVQSSSPMDLEPEHTLVDADWWARWKDQNEGKNPLLDHGAIWEVGTAESKPTPPL